MHVQTKREQEEQAVLRDIMHTIAVDTDSEHCLKAILDSAQLAAAATGSCFFYFDRPDTRIDSGIGQTCALEADALREALASLAPGIHPLAPDLVAGGRAFAAPITVDQTLAGAMVLLFDAAVDGLADSSGLLASLVDALAIVVTRLRAEDRFKKVTRNQAEFVRLVTHDLRTPLTYMQGFAGMLQMGPIGELNERQNQFVDKILSGITQITALVDNIQDAGRYDPETGFYEMSRSQVDLGEMAYRIVSNHLVPAEKQLSISVQVDDDVPIVSADSNMLERAIVNLVDNAIKYTPSGGDIVVSVRMRDNSVVLGVKDSGLGISPENQKQLFQRHVRIARQEHKKIKGSGLGLFIVRSVAQRHGGTAWVESVEGQGSTFLLSIPLTGANLIVPE
jgi:signal transduction histidine kinase